MEFLINEKMLKNSLVKMGNTSKLKEVLKKKKIKIAFLGGSITEGFNSSEYAKCYVHFIISTLIANFVEKALKENCCEEKVVLGEPIFGDDFIEGTIKNSTNITIKESKGFLIDSYGFQNFRYGWRFNSLSNNALLVVQIECKNIFLLYKKIINKKAGKMKVTVDNEKEVIIDTFFENGWGDYSATEILVKSNEKSLHEIKIEVIDFNEKSIVNILGFLVS